MLWRYNGGPKCPRCENRATVLTERTLSNGIAVVRYTLKCPSCGFREVMQELTIARTERGVRIKVSAVGR
jgi:uncharacterized Zn finger protein